MKNSEDLKALLDELESGIDKCKKKKIEEKMLIASRLDDIRKSRGLSTKREFSNFFNKRPSEIQKWLGGKHNFTIDTLIEIAEKLSIDYKEFLFEKGIYTRLQNNMNCTVYMSIPIQLNQPIMGEKYSTSFPNMQILTKTRSIKDKLQLELKQ